MPNQQTTERDLSKQQQKNQGEWTRQMLFKRYLLQIFSTQMGSAELLGYQNQRVTTNYINIVTAFLALNSTFAIATVYFKYGGIFTKAFGGTVGLVCYINISWHYYWIQMLHKSSLKQIISPVGHWYRTKYRQHFGTLTESKNSQQYYQIFIKPFQKSQ